MLKARPVAAQADPVRDSGRLAGESRDLRPGPARNPQPEDPGARNPGEAIEEEAANAWPGEAEEAAFLSGAKEPVASVAAGAIPGAVSAEAAEAGPSPAEASELAERGEPPPLEELVQRVPPELRTALEELFRARFTRVTRVRAGEKKAGPA